MSSTLNLIRSKIPAVEYVHLSIAVVLNLFKAATAFNSEFFLQHTHFFNTVEVNSSDHR
jgi:hypothetical protein